jgi:hypothetical protein
MAVGAAAGESDASGPRNQDDRGGRRDAGACGRVERRGAHLGVAIGRQGGRYPQEGFLVRLTCRTQVPLSCRGLRRHWAGELNSELTVPEGAIFAARVPVSGVNEADEQSVHASFGKLFGLG